MPSANRATGERSIGRNTLNRQAPVRPHLPMVAEHRSTTLLHPDYHNSRTNLSSCRPREITFAISAAAGIDCLVSLTIPAAPVHCIVPPCFCIRGGQSETDSSVVLHAMQTVSGQRVNSPCCRRDTSTVKRDRLHASSIEVIDMIALLSSRSNEDRHQKGINGFQFGEANDSQAFRLAFQTPNQVRLNRLYFSSRKTLLPIVV